MMTGTTMMNGVKSSSVHCGIKREGEAQCGMTVSSSCSDSGGSLSDTLESAQKTQRCSSGSGDIRMVFPDNDVDDELLDLFMLASNSPSGEGKDSGGNNMSMMSDMPFPTTEDPLKPELNNTFELTQSLLNQSSTLQPHPSTAHQSRPQSSSLSSQKCDMRGVSASQQQRHDIPRPSPHLSAHPSAHSPHMSPVSPHSPPPHSHPQHAPPHTPEHRPMGGSPHLRKSAPNLNMHNQQSAGMPQPTHGMPRSHSFPQLQHATTYSPNPHVSPRITAAPLSSTPHRSSLPSDTRPLPPPSHTLSRDFGMPTNGVSFSNMNGNTSKQNHFNKQSLQDPSNPFAGLLNGDNSSSPSINGGTPSSSSSDSSSSSSSFSFSSSGYVPNRAKGAGSSAPKRRYHTTRQSTKGQTRSEILARKAELARQSRRRKKLYVQDLEDKVKRLGAKIEELQQKQAREAAQRRTMNFSAEEKARQESQQHIKKQLFEIVKGLPDQNPDDEKVSHLVANFVNNSRQRQARIEYYLDRVEDCITPGLQTKFVLWGLDQQNEFYDKPNGLWYSLMQNELGLNEQQLETLKARRQSIAEERKALRQTEQMLKHMRRHASQHLENLNNRMDELTRILTPLQLAKFFVWVEENKWCMEMLNSMWSQQ